MLAKLDYVVGLGTTCNSASYSSRQGNSKAVVKFSWRIGAAGEVSLLLQAYARGVEGIISGLGEEDLCSVTDFRQGLPFPGPFIDRIFSYVATTLRGRSLQHFKCNHELLVVLSDYVPCLKSLYMDEKMFHGDVAIKNMILAPRHGVTDNGTERMTGVLIDFDQTLDLDNVNDNVNDTTIN